MPWSRAAASRVVVPLLLLGLALAAPLLADALAPWFPAPSAMPQVTPDVLVQVGVASTIALVIGLVGGTACALSTPTGGGWLAPTAWLLGAGAAVAANDPSVWPDDNIGLLWRVWMYAGALGCCLPGATRSWLNPGPSAVGVSLGRLALVLGTLHGTMLAMLVLGQAVIEQLQTSAEPILILVIIGVMTWTLVGTVGWTAAMTGPVQPARQHLAVWASSAILLLQLDRPHRFDAAAVALLSMPVLIGVTSSIAIWVRGRAARRWTHDQQRATWRPSEQQGSQHQ